MARFGIGDSLDGDDRLLLLGEDDPAVEEGRDDVLDDEVHLGLAHLVKVLVEVSPATEREGGCYSKEVPKDLLYSFNFWFPMAKEGQRSGKVHSVKLYP